MKIDERLDESEVEFFKELNVRFGLALDYLSTEDNEVKGRERELKNLSYIMRKRKKPNAILTGDAGTGKTEIVKTWAKRQVEHNVHLLTLNIGALNPAEHKERLSTLLPELKKYQDFLNRKDETAIVVLFIDEFHNVISNFQFPSKEGGDLLKPTLNESGKYVRFIAATTWNEFDAYVSSDKPLKRRMENLPINEVSYELTIKILHNWLVNEKGEAFANSVDESVLETIVTSNKRYSTELSEPAKSIDMLELMVAMFEEDQESGDTDTQMNIDLVEKVFNFTKNVDLTFNVDYEEASNHLRSRIRGQPFVIRAMNIALMRLSFGLRKDENQPLFTALLTGTSGTGKTETVKQLTQAIYKTQKRLHIISMTNYNTEQSAEMFRREVGTKARRNPASVFLFDEIEKAHDTVILSLLPILDEGSVTFYERSSDGYDLPTTVSLKNTMMFATTNSGDEIYEKINSTAHEILEMNQDDLDEVTDKTEQMYIKIKPEIEQALKTDNFRPELLQRFKNIIPYSTLTKPALLDIAFIKLQETRELFSQKGYDIKILRPIDWTKYGYPYVANDICMYIVIDKLQTTDAGASGARRIVSVIEDEIESKILEALADKNNEGYTEFLIKTDDKVSFKNTDDAITTGKIVVDPIR